MAAIERGETVLATVGVTKRFGRAGGWLQRRDSLVTAVDDVTLALRRGEALGLVGESGSGKTTLGRLLVGFEQPTAGEVQVEGRDLSSLGRAERRAHRRTVQMVFQNPYSSLNPRRTIRDTLSAGYRIHGLARGAALNDELAQMLDRVGLHASMLDRYPHEFSGGQRQRIVIARALSVGPQVLVADEPVSALDVSIQAQVLNLLRSLQEEMHLTVAMITHDLRVANFFCDRIGVLYLGRLVELGEKSVIVERSYHPYTRMLMSAAPVGDPDVRPVRRLVRGEIDTSPPDRTGCVFANRCWLRRELGNPERCVAEVPEPRPVAGPHLAACHYAEEVESRSEAAAGEPAPTVREQTA
jgi:oligopeptide/dipeptide ABC transporter ATP-binding protein